MTLPSLRPLTQQKLERPPQIGPELEGWTGHTGGTSQRLAELAGHESSAVARCQAYLAAALLAALDGDRAHAVELLRRATHAVPKLTVPAVLYRALGATTEPQELLEQSLTQTLKYAELLAARAHAAVELSKLREQAGQPEMALKILESLGPAPADPAVALRRTLLCLALGEAVPPGLPFLGGVAEAQSVLDKRRSASAEPSLGLLLLGATRALRAGDFDRFLGLLQEFCDLGHEPTHGSALSDPARAIAEATRIALLFGRKSSEAAALARAKDLVQRRQGQKLLPRLLARLSARVRDSTGVAVALAGGGVGFQTFDASEQVLLSHLAGNHLTLADSEALVGSGSGSESPELSEALSWSLGGYFGGSASEPEIARARVGGLLGSLLGEAGQREVSAWASAEPASRAELLLPLVAAVRAEDPSQLARALAELAAGANEAELHVLAGHIAEVAGESALAVAQYDALSKSPEAELAIQGLLGLDRVSGTTAERCHDLVTTARRLEPAPAAELMFQAARGLDPATAAAALREAYETAPADSPLRPLALFTSYLEERRAFGSASRNEALADLLTFHQGGLRDAAAVLLASLSGTPEEGREALAQVSEAAQRDVSYGRLWIALGDPFELVPPNPSSTWACSEQFLAHATSGDRRGAYELLNEAPGVASGLLRDLKRALELELGISGSLAIDLIENAPGTSDPEQREAAIFRLIELEEARGDDKSADMWRRFVVNEGLGGPRALLGLEAEAYRSGSVQQVRALFAELGEKLPAKDAAPYFVVEAALALGARELRATRRAEAFASSLFLQRALASEAWDRTDAGRVRALLEQVLPDAGTELDAVALLTEISRLALAEGKLEAALDAAERAQARFPSAFTPALLAWTALDRQLTDEADASPQHASLAARRGELLLRLAEACALREHRVAVLLEAGSEFERTGEAQKAENCYREVLALDREDEEAFSRLRGLAQGSALKTLELLQGRLTEPLPVVQRTALEREVAELLLHEGRAADALEVTRSALKREVDNAELFRLHAQAAEQLEQYPEALSAWKKASEHLPEGPDKLETLRHLGRLAAQRLERFEVAMDAFEAALERAPGDLEIMVSLVDVFSELRLVDRAATLQTQVIQATEPAAAKVDEVVKLARIYRVLAGDLGKAQSTLERASRAWPLDARVLGARAQLLEEAGGTASRRMLVERAGKEARRQLESGRLERELFETFALSQQLLGHSAVAAGAIAARQVLDGAHQELSAGVAFGKKALAPALTALLAPTPVSRALAALLAKASPALDLALSFDPSKSQAQKVTPEQLPDFAELAGGVLPPGYELFELGASTEPMIVPVSQNPARFLFSKDLPRLPAVERRFLMFRALKLHGLGAATLSRLSGEDAAAALGGLLLLFSPHFQPRGVDGRKLGQNRALLEQAFTRTGYSNEVPSLALEVVGALGTSRLSEPGLLELANRAAFLAIGDLGAATRRVVPAADLAPLSGPLRARWFERHSEAKDLLLFRSSESFVRASEQLAREL